MINFHYKSKNFLAMLINISLSEIQFCFPTDVIYKLLLLIVSKNELSNVPSVKKSIIHIVNQFSNFGLGLSPVTA